MDRFLSLLLSFLCVLFFLPFTFFVRSRHSGYVVNYFVLYLWFRLNICLCGIVSVLVFNLVKNPCGYDGLGACFLFAGVCVRLWGLSPIFWLRHLLPVTFFG